jgi:hypothetical protein
MRSQILDASALGRGLDNVPDRLWRDAFTPCFAEPVNTQENPAFADPSSFCPLVNSSLRPSGDRHGADMFSLSDQIGDHPMLLAKLEIFDSQTHKFGPEM